MTGGIIRRVERNLVDENSVGAGTGIPVIEVEVNAI
jgi:hypothetical protein